MFKKAAFIFSLLSAVSGVTGEELPHLIRELKISKNKITVKAHGGFSSRYLTQDFFVKYEKDIDLESLPKTIVTMPFIMMVASAVWISGEKYQISEMDEDLYESLKKVKQVAQVLYPSTYWAGEIIPQKLVKTPKPDLKDETHTALLFSGGLDSTVSSLFHREKKQLLISAWGQWDLPLDKPWVWKKVKKRFMRFKECCGHETSFIRSNYVDFFNLDYLASLSPEMPKWRMYAVEDIGWAGLTAPILYAKGYPVLRIASSDTWDTGYPIMANPFIDSNITYAGIRLEHDLFDYSRLDKVEYLANLCTSGECESPFLTICADALTNCCNCSKCLSTVLGLIVAGAEPRDYGFYASRRRIIAHAKKYLKDHAKNYVNIERFTAIQNKIRERIDQGDTSLDDLKWLLKIDFDKYFESTYENRRQQKISWKVLHDMFPHIDVPEKYLS